MLRICGSTKSNIRLAFIYARSYPISDVEDLPYLMFDDANSHIGSDGSILFVLTRKSDVWKKKVLFFFVVDNLFE